MQRRGAWRIRQVAECLGGCVVEPCCSRAARWQAPRGRGRARRIASRSDRQGRNSKSRVDRARRPSRVTDARLRTDLRNAGGFSRVHPLPRSGADVPDDLDARLVVLPPEHPYSKEMGARPTPRRRPFWNPAATRQGSIGTRWYSSPQTTLGSKISMRLCGGTWLGRPFSRRRIRWTVAGWIAGSGY